MERYILSCESTVDVPKEYLEQRHISCICYPYELGGQVYRDDFGETLPLEQFYQAMAGGADTKTAQINACEFMAYFEPFLADGKDVLHLCLSSGLTGVMNAAQIAKSTLEEKYPGRKICLVDSLAASSGGGLLVERLADLRNAGMEIEPLRQWAEDNKRRVNHWFFSSDLKYYIRGGRVSRTSGTVGTMLGVCPLLEVDAEGRLVLRGRPRGAKKAILALCEKMRALADDGAAYHGPCIIAHSACPELAEQAADAINRAFPAIPGGVRICQIGAIVGAHTGPGTVALLFWGAPRVN